MGGVILFSAGLIVGVVYQAAIKAWKRKLEKAAVAAKDALAD